MCWRPLAACTRAAFAGSETRPGSSTCALAWLGELVPGSPLQVIVRKRLEKRRRLSGFSMDRGAGDGV